MTIFRSKSEESDHTGDPFLFSGSTLVVWEQENHYNGKSIWKEVVPGQGMRLFESSAIWFGWYWKSALVVKEVLVLFEGGKI
ncbi:MAG: hypothetical protein A2169_04115 [Deltaproteobacteria bacterium RBG_13_47_9]|nr:MAG: hypothetical protein A2169_04115 [Deltaproteobacteria bacterium RBG_13_47_9]